MVGSSDEGGLCTIGLPPHSLFSLAEVNDEFLYVLKFGRIVGMPKHIESDTTNRWPNQSFFFRPGDLIDTRIFANIPITMETITWTELSRIPCAQIRGDLVRRLRSEALATPSLYMTATRAIETSKALSSGVKSLVKKRPSTLDRWNGNNPEPAYAAMIRDPIVRLIMQSDGVIEQDIHDVIHSLQRI